MKTGRAISDNNETVKWMVPYLHHTARMTRRTNSALEIQSLLPASDAAAVYGTMLSAFPWQGETIKNTSER
jgi:hypothetical protein